MKKFLLATVLLLGSVQAHAEQFWVGDFQISNLFVSLAENLHYRIYGLPNTAACNNGPNWAYVNESDSGGKGKLAAILMAYSTGKSVRVFVEPTNGYCHIIEIFISG